MEWNLPDLPGVGGFAGVLALLVWLIVHLNRQASSDRRDYQSALTAQRERHGMDHESTKLRHDDEMDKLRLDNQRLRDELEAVREQLAEARSARWEAEDQAARYRRLAGRDADGTDEG